MMQLVVADNRLRHDHVIASSGRNCRSPLAIDASSSVSDISAFMLRVLTRLLQVSILFGLQSNVADVGRDG